MSATILNITSASQASVTFNGNNLTAFTYNAATKVISFGVNLQLGYNTVTIMAANSAGSVSKSVVINHKPQGRPPKVTISNPASSPFTSLQSNFIVSGYVYGVASSGNISVTANTVSVPFNYNLSTHEIDIPLNLSSPSTKIDISAFNTYGSDAGSVELIFNKTVAAQSDTTSLSGNTQIGGNNNTGGGTTGGGTIGTSGGHGMGAVHGDQYIPDIAILSPIANPFYTNTGVVTVAAKLSHVIDPAKVSVTYNGIQVSFSFDIGSKQLNFSSPLKSGMNTFVIIADNAYGSATKSVSINYTPINVGTPAEGKNNPVGAPVGGQGGFNLGGIKTGGNQPTEPKKTTTDGGQVNPNIKGNPNQSQPRTVQPESGTTKPAEGTETKPDAGGGQIRLKPR